MAFKRIRVLIVDDSIFFQGILKKALENDKYIDIVATAGSADEAEKIINDIPLDVVTLDVEMPGRRGPELLSNLMPVKPIPVVLVSSLDMSVFEALQSGAIDFVKKPDMSKSNEFENFANELAVKIKIASAANVRKNSSLSNDNTPPKLRHNSNVQTIVAIGASTGGTEATLEIVKQFPADFPPVLITQHMPAGFTKMYADRLNKICNMRVEEAQDNMRVENGLAIIAAGENQMRLNRDSNGYYITSKPGEKVSGHCPSVDVLFESVAKHAESNAIGVILTGMGKDGANGLLSIHKKGAYTIGQDKDSCVVYGMPMVAFNLGAVDIQAPIQNIASLVIKQLNIKNK